MKQRLPFILLGIGIGIILANIVYSFVPNVEYREYTDEEIIEQAKGLGMIFIKDNIEVSNDEVDDKIEEKVDVKEVEEIVFVVEEGDYLSDISNNLMDAGLIEDVESFKEYAESVGADKKFRIGTYILNTEMNYGEIINLLIKKK